MDIVYLNGHYLPRKEATISVMDRGFLFGDGVYEVIPVYNLKPFRGLQHINRLYRSLKNIHLPIALNENDIATIFNELITRNSDIGPNQSIYLQVTRGAASERNHAFPKEVSPTIFAFSYPLKTLPFDVLVKGMHAITLEDTRWKYCNIKSISLLPNVLLYQEALDRSAVEAILIRDGKAIEGATSNLFIVKDEVIITPPLSHYILGGITRELVLELAESHKLKSQETDITETMLLKADEVWITSSTREIFPITKLNETLINQGIPGQIWHKMIKNYRDYIKKL